MEQEPKLAFTIDHMQPDDVEPATRMRLQSWLDTYVNDELGVTREWIEARNAAQLSPERIKKRIDHLASPNVAGYVARSDDGEIIGSTTPFRDADGIQHVGSLYVDKRYHGSGLAHQLMQKVIDWSDPTQPIELGVVSYNLRARAFYEKWKFEAVPGSDELFDDKIPEFKMIRKGDAQ